ncbi:SurA N-terminal domain-containing protein [Candidatus Woesearchaeota archaeon]|nr:SurA N-terminal domain-containing protein [Candidatus Woesearchaeota archaeon]
MEKGARKRAAAVVAAALIAVILVAGCTGNGTGDRKKGDVAATVNGVSIYFGEVEEEYASLSPGQGEGISKADALSFVIEREILYQQAVKERLTATGEEQRQAYELLLLESNVTEQELARQLSERNSSVERLKAGLRRQILIDKLLDKAAGKSYIIKKEEVEAVYNSGNFKSAGVSFEAAQKGIVDMLTAQRQRAGTEVYIQGLKDNAKVVIIAVPG